MALSPGQRAQIACILEATARKPGNVHRFVDFADCTYLDFVLSASALVKPLDRAREIGVGAAVLEAVEATRQVVSTNTNLGMILLLAPLAAVPEGVDLHAGLRDVLKRLTVDDARHAYRAIRLARPGGLGEAAQQDVADEPTVTLREAMALAADRDAIARQYVTGYEDVFEIALVDLRDALHNDGLPLETAIIRAYLTLMTYRPDTLIARKRGGTIAEAASLRASAMLADWWPHTDASIDAFRAFDAWLRADGNARNPGATADLIAAALYAALRDGTIKLPLQPGRAGWAGADLF